MRMGSAMVPHFFQSIAMAESATELKRLGNEAFANKEYKKAAKIYRDALKLDFNPVLLSNRAMCFIKLEDWERAIRDCKEGLAISPPPEANLQIKLWYRLGVAYKGMGKPQNSKSALERALLLDSANAAARVALEEAKELLSKMGSLSVPISSVDKLPEKYSKLLQNRTDDDKLPVQNRTNAEILTAGPSVQAQREISELFPTNTPSVPSGKKSDATAFHKRSAMHFLPKISDQLTSQQKASLYKAILDVPPADYEEAFAVGGVDTDFLPTFFEAANETISSGKELFSDYEPKIYTLLKTFYKMPRYQIALSFCNEQVISSFLEKISEFDSKSHQQFKELL